jgi:kumamolisin
VHHKRAVPLVGLLVLVAATALPVHALSASSTADPALVRPAALAPAVPHDAVRLGALDPRQAVSFDVTLAPSHPGELASLMRALSDPSSPRYQQWLPRGEFARRFAPTRADVAAVVGWLRGVGLGNARVVDGHIEVHTAAHTASSALGVSFARYASADGTQSYSPDRAPLVPREIAPAITAIVGLSDTPHLQPHLEILTAPGSIHPTSTPHAQSCAATITKQANSLGGWTTRQIGTKYQVPPLLNAGLNGAGKTIAIYELAPHTPSDTSAYLTCFGLHNTVTTKAVSGGAPDTDPGGVVEADLDIEAAAATAPGAKIISYEGPNTELGSIRTWQAIVNDDTAQVVSTSWGICENFESANQRRALHAAFTQAAAQGQTIFAATGDAGSEDCLFSTGSSALAVDSPANEPLVTGVGGTTMEPNVAITKPSHEPVWNDCAGTIGFTCADSGGGAGGGGLSKAYAKPSWQPAARVSTCHPGCRQVPDLAANSGVGEAFLSDGAWNLIGGTSIASPKLAGIAADIVKGCVSSLGPFNRKVYALASAGGIYGTALRDVPAGQGDNDLTRNNDDRYSSGSGYDLATGMGTPLASGLVCPEVARVAPANAAVGAKVKITGLGLSRATIRFGNTAAKVVARSSTALTVIVPHGSGKVQVRGSGTMGKGTFHASFTYHA